ncbi:MAG: hypothetical protein AAFO83_00270 [Cyanobacteria bacterium J06607_13]
MAFADVAVMDLANQVIDWSSETAGTFYTAQTVYSYYQDLTDELGGIALQGAAAYPPPIRAATPQDITVKDRWYVTQGSYKRTRGGSIQTDGYDSEIYLLEFAAAGYTNAVGEWSGTTGDLGLVVTNGTATGKLLDYDNTERKWWIRITSGTFADGDSITITGGTGAGTLLTPDGVDTGEEGAANLGLLGTVSHWEATYFKLGDRIIDPVADGYYSSAPSSAPDLLFKIREKGALIASGILTVFNRCNRDLANSIDGSTVGDTYDWVDVDLSNFGRTPGSLGTQQDLSDTLTNAQAVGYLDAALGGTGATDNITAATAGPYDVDVNSDGSTEAYAYQLDASQVSNANLWSAFFKYYFRKGSTDATLGVQAQVFRFINAAYAVTRASPAGTIAGAVISLARGWVLVNPGSADASNYRTIPTAGGNPISPLVFRLRERTGLTAGQKVTLFRRSSPGFALKTEFTLNNGAGGNTNNQLGAGAIVINEAIPLDKAPSGFIRIFDNDGDEDRYPYSSWSGSEFVLDSVTLTKNYPNGGNAYAGYIDDTATGPTYSVALPFVADRDVTSSIRKGSGSDKIEPDIANYTLTDADSSVPAAPSADGINNN